MTPAAGPTIRVSTGVGSGRTRLTAFDAALIDAGVGDFNLVRLSSVIPPASTVLTVPGTDQIRGDHGDLLYCVYAAAYCSTPHAEAWAGLGWSLATDGSGAGLFVEHEGWSEHEVSTDVENSLRSLSERRGSRYQKAGSVITSIRCIDQPVCGVAVASYRAVGWSSDAEAGDPT
jgi:arginine decarboxylase